MAMFNDPTKRDQTKSKLQTLNDGFFIETYKLKESILTETHKMLVFDNLQDHFHQDLE